MDNGFRKFKQKIRLSAIIRALLMGLSLGVVAVAALWLVAKLTNTAPTFTPNFLQYGVIGGGIALVCSAIFIALMLPTDKRLAKRLDNKLEMHEKVQTMIAFRKEDSEMIRMQRENTQELLMQTPTKKARSKTAWLSMILPVVACACMAAAIVVPAQGVQGDKPVDESGWFLSVYDEQKLLNLIEYVQTSGMQEEPKAGIVTELNDLLTDLKAIKKKVIMQERVINAITDIHEIAKPCHTHTDIVSALKGAVSTEVIAMGNAISALEDNTIKTHMQTLLETLKAGDKEALATALSADLQTALSSTGQTEENALQKALADFAAELATVKADFTELQLQELVNRGESAIAIAIKQPGIDVGVERYTINHLMSIFGISADSIPQEILDTFDDASISGDTDSSGSDEDGKSHAGGGIGPGNVLVGSNDEIYDPSLDDQVVYGEVLTQYQSVILDYITDGNIPSELEEMVTAYLAILARPEEAE